MSYERNDDLEALCQRLQSQSQTRPLREQMLKFVQNHGTSNDLPSLRRKAKAGTDRSAIVKQERDGRL